LTGLDKTYPESSIELDLQTYFIPSCERNLQTNKPTDNVQNQPRLQNEHEKGQIEIRKKRKKINYKKIDHIKFILFSHIVLKRFLNDLRIKNKTAKFFLIKLWNEIKVVAWHHGFNSLGIIIYKLKIHLIKTILSKTNK